MRDNLDFVLKATGCSDKRKRQFRIEEVLELVGMLTKGYKMPHELSGGEQQRIVIARAILNTPDIILADDEASFVRLMRSAAMRTGQQLVYSDLARDAGVSPKTAAVWVGILQASGVVELLEPYYVNTIKRLAKTPKLYFTDTGLCSWLAGWRSPESLMESNFSGAILETWVYGQLMRSYANAGVKPLISYYREELDTTEAT